MTLNGNKINLPKSVTIMFRDKFKIRHIITLSHHAKTRLKLVHISFQQLSKRNCIKPA